MYNFEILKMQQNIDNLNTAFYIMVICLIIIYIAYLLIDTLNKDKTSIMIEILENRIAYFEEFYEKERESLSDFNTRILKNSSEILELYEKSELRNKELIDLCLEIIDINKKMVETMNKFRCIQKHKSFLKGEVVIGFITNDFLYRA